MSDNWLIFVPKDPLRVPDGGVEDAVAIASEAFPNADVKAEVHQVVQFIDQGANFENVSCPLCDVSLMENFGEIMGEGFDAEAGGFTRMNFVTPCCEIGRAHV